MKTSNSILKSILALNLGLFLTATPLAMLAQPAEEATNAAPPTTGKDYHPHGQASAGRNDGGLPPKDVLDRMSPEQIVEWKQADNPGFGLETALIPLGFFVCAFGIVGIAINAHLKRNRVLHDTLRAMIEKGAPIPPELIAPPKKPQRSGSDLRRGLVCIGIGIGMTLWMLGMGGRLAEAFGLGLIPLLIGVAFLITWKVESKKNGQT